MNHFLHTLKHRERDEEGVVLFMVVGLSLFVFTVVLVIASTSLMNVTLTGKFESAFRALDYAEAGRDTALADLVNGKCSPTGQEAATATSPGYSYTIYRYTATDEEIPTAVSQPGVTVGCPLAGFTHVLIESVGVDQRGQQKTIVATFGWNDPPTSGPFTSFLGDGYSDSRILSQTEPVS